MSLSAIPSPATSKGASAPPASASIKPGTPTGTQEQFLKLLTTQLQNQDPLNPMDNAQLTSQIAQINTVSGISQLNSSVQGLSSQFLQMQTLQGAGLVGKNVTVPGNQVDVIDGQGVGGFALDSAADQVDVSIINQAGKVIGSMNLGPQSAGTHQFTWDAGPYADTPGLTFKVGATNGATDLTPTSLMRDTVNAVSASGSKMKLQLEKSGNVDYASVAAFE